LTSLVSMLTVCKLCSFAREATPVSLRAVRTCIDSTRAISPCRFNNVVNYYAFDEVCTEDDFRLLFSRSVDSLQAVEVDGHKHPYEPHQLCNVYLFPRLKRCRVEFVRLRTSDEWFGKFEQYILKAIAECSASGPSELAESPALATTSVSPQGYVSSSNGSSLVGTEAFQQWKREQATMRSHDESSSTISVDKPLLQQGVTSIQAIRLASRLRELTGSTVSSMLVFQHPTLQKIALHLQKGGAPGELTHVEALRSIVAELVHSKKQSEAPPAPEEKKEPLQTNAVDEKGAKTLHEELQAAQEAAATAMAGASKALTALVEAEMRRSRR